MDEICNLLTTLRDRAWDAHLDRIWHLARLGLALLPEREQAHGRASGAAPRRRRGERQRETLSDA